MALSLLASGCDFEGYCIDCADAPSQSIDADQRDGMAATDGSTSQADACVAQGSEQCDGLDNDCDGMTDEGTLPQVGDSCSNAVGECKPGTKECIDGELVCGGGGVEPIPEICDGLDNDCDGTDDNGDPGGGVLCGTDTGECVSGVTRCVSGNVECVGEVGPQPEECDGKDNDCNNLFDDGIAEGATCGTTDQGQCSLGSEQCIGGVMQCVGANGPTTEQCDGLDHDCDGDPTNGFDLQADAQNCGTCGRVCSAPNANMRCSNGDCEIAGCQQDYWDNDPGVAGCEYGPCVFRGPVEACNQQDDNCDGQIDEDLSVPDLCNPLGACGTPGKLDPICTSNGWVCDYESQRPDVQVDGNGDILPESLCDNIDNDCDGAVDEGHPLKGTPCDDGGIGICRGTGTLQCDGDPTAPLTCVIDTPGQPALGAELCNDLDDNCNGTIDEGAATGSIHSWVDIGGGVEIFAYEASRPDASQTSTGTVTSHPCSNANAIPWTNVTYPEAVAACSAIGARLCTEAEWQSACELPPRAASKTQDSTGLVFFEAEDFDARVDRDDRWRLRTTHAGYVGTGAMYADDDDGDQYNSNYVSQSPRMDYSITFNRTGTHYVWIRGYAEGSGDNTVHAGLNGAGVNTADRIGNYTTDGWIWVNVTLDGNQATIDIPSTGTHTVNIWMREDGFYADRVVITSDADFNPNTTQPDLTCDWSYHTNCDDYTPATCNGLDRDDNTGTPENDNELTYTGELASCRANHGAAGSVFDLSGNVGEWTQARSGNINPIRGGSITSNAVGISCDYDFVVASDTFFFPSVGFRCCR